jgi:hypothetical protein
MDERLRQGSIVVSLFSRIVNVSCSMRKFMIPWKHEGRKQCLEDREVWSVAREVVVRGK